MNNILKLTFALGIVFALLSPPVFGATSVEKTLECTDGRNLRDSMEQRFIVCSTEIIELEVNGEVKTFTVQFNFRSLHHGDPVPAQSTHNSARSPNGGYSVYYQEDPSQLGGFVHVYAKNTPKDERVFKKYYCSNDPDTFSECYYMSKKIQSYEGDLGKDVKLELEINVKLFGRKTEVQSWGKEYLPIKVVAVLRLRAPISSL